MRRLAPSPPGCGAPRDRMRLRPPARQPVPAHDVPAPAAPAALMACPRPTPCGCSSPGCSTFPWRPSARQACTRCTAASTPCTRRGLLFSTFGSVKWFESRAPQPPTPCPRRGLGQGRHEGSGGSGRQREQQLLAAAAGSSALRNGCAPGSSNQQTTASPPPTRSACAPPQFFVHTQLVGRCWWPVELVMNTPSHHRVHHARNYGRRCVGRHAAGLAALVPPLVPRVAPRCPRVLPCIARRHAACCTPQACHGACTAAWLLQMPCTARPSPPRCAAPSHTPTPPPPLWCSNFAGVLIIWDRLFGTFEEEQRSRPCIYGLDASVGLPCVLSFFFRSFFFYCDGLFPWAVMRLAACLLRLQAGARM